MQSYVHFDLHLLPPRAGGGGGVAAIISRRRDSDGYNVCYFEAADVIHWTTTCYSLDYDLLTLVLFRR